jgi:prepilin-type processing-associated H-X9-DG protein
MGQTVAYTACCDKEPPTGSDTNGNFNAVAWYSAPPPNGSGNTYYTLAPTGIIYPTSAITIRQVPDGLTKTYLFGEKALQPQQYDPAGLTIDTRNYGDDNTMYRGYDYDSVRWACSISPSYSSTQFATAIADTSNRIMYLPLQDKNDPNLGTWGVQNFGAAHSSGCQFAMCDGSVQTVPYSIDPLVHYRLANRMDGQSVSLP